MVIESFDIAVYTFMFLVPGYIIDGVMNSLSPMKNHSEGIKLIRWLMYSMINYAVWFSWGLKLYNKVLDPKSALYWFVLVLLVVITGVLTGVILGIIRAKDSIFNFVNKKLSKRLKITLTHPIPSAWDYVFKTHTNGSWVTVRMDNDKFIRGRFYTKSFASSDESYRDIYLEEVYTKNEDEQWIKRERTQGVWLSPDSIKHIEFYTNENKNNIKEAEKNAGEK